MKAITREEKIISGENLTPITRKEMFLAKASGQNIQTPTPITREEYFLSKITGGGTGGGGGVEGTAIPVGEKVEKIYFNTNLSVEETNAYLSQLTYVQTELMEYPIYGIWGYMTSQHTTIIYAVAEPLSSNLKRCYVGGIIIDNDTGAIRNTFDIFNPAINSNVQKNEGFAAIDYEFCVQLVYGTAFYWENISATPISEFMGLPIGAENEKIKNVLSITPFGASGGTSTNEPLAYTVSSVDELPTNAVDGSLAVVEAESTAEAWVFYDELDNLGESYTAWYDEETSNCISPFNIEYSNYDVGIVIGEPNKVWKKFSVGVSGPSSWGIYVLNAFDDEIDATVGLYMHNPNGDYGFPHGWKDDKFKTIQVHYADEEARQWLEAHATSLGKAIIRELYTRQNGQWVYTGEVA